MDNLVPVERGYTVDIFEAEDRNIVLRKYGEWHYDHLILFAPSANGELILLSNYASIRRL
jgi:hypothetical protein